MIINDTRDEIRAELAGLLDEVRGTLEVIKASGIQGVAEVSLTLEELAGKARKCSACRLSETRTVFGFGYGKEDSEVLFVADAPFGEGTYDGEEGGLLAKMIEGMKYDIGDVYVTFALKCGPPPEAAPDGGGLAEEIRACRPFLLKQIRKISPRVIIALGPVAAEALLGSTDISALRGRMHEFEGASLRATYGPRELLKNPALKRDAWGDLLACMRLLGKE